MIRRYAPLALLIGLAVTRVHSAPEEPAAADALDQEPAPEMNGVQRAANGMIGAMEPFVELFGTELPNTLAKYRIEVSIDPKFGDFVHEDQVRVPIEFRYGLSRRTEIYTEIEPFFPNWTEGDATWGFSYWRLGAKQQLPIDSKILRVAIGADARYPLSFPPGEPSDGYMRAQPYITFERDLKILPDTSVFLNVGYEFVEYIGGYNNPDDFIYDEDNIRFTGGLIHHRGIWNPFLRAEYRFEVDDNPQQDSWFIEPGVLVDLPVRYTRRVPGKWKVEAGLRYQVEDDEGEFEFNVRVTWRVRLRQLGIRLGD